MNNKQGSGMVPTQILTKELKIARTRKKPPAPADLLKLVETSLDDDKADSVVIIDLAGKSSLTDYMVIASGTSQRHVGAMAVKLREKIKQSGIKTVTTEGENQCDWVLIDSGDVIVHLFRPEVREFYNLEKMWGVPVPDEASDTAKGLMA